MILDANKISSDKHLLSEDVDLDCNSQEKLADYSISVIPGPRFTSNWTGISRTDGA